MEVWSKLNNVHTRLFGTLENGPKICSVCARSLKGAIFVSARSQKIGGHSEIRSDSDSTGKGRKGESLISSLLTFKYVGFSYFCRSMIKLILILERVNSNDQMHYIKAKRETLCSEGR